MYSFLYVDGAAAIDCVDCGDCVEIPCTREQAMRRSRGEGVSAVFPELSAELREMFISGICPKCWDKIFAADEELSV
jgi:hypothetical protein